MANINYVKISGNLTRDPHTGKTADRKDDNGKTIKGREYAMFTVACNGNGGRTQYINCSAWGKIAEKVGTLKRGDSVGVIGYIASTVREENGQRIYGQQVNVNQVCQIPREGHNLDCSAAFGVSSGTGSGGGAQMRMEDNGGTPWDNDRWQ